MGLITGMDYQNGYFSVALSTLNAFYMHRITFEVKLVVCEKYFPSNYCKIARRGGSVGVGSGVQ